MNSAELLTNPARTPCTISKKNRHTSAQMGAWIHGCQTIKTVKVKGAIHYSHQQIQNPGIITIDHNNYVPIITAKNRWMMTNHEEQCFEKRPYKSPSCLPLFSTMDAYMYVEPTHVGKLTIHISKSTDQKSNELPDISSCEHGSLRSAMTAWAVIDIAVKQREPDEHKTVELDSTGVLDQYRLCSRCIMGESPHSKKWGSSQQQSNSSKKHGGKIPLQGEWHGERERSKKARRRPWTQRFRDPRKRGAIHEHHEREWSTSSEKYTAHESQALREVAK